MRWHHIGRNFWGEDEEFGRARGAQVTDKVHSAGNVHLLLFAEASAHTLCGGRVIAYYPMVGRARARAPRCI